MNTVKLSVDIVKSLSTFEVATYFALLTTMDNTGHSKAMINDIAAILGTSNITGKHFRSFAERNIIKIEKKKSELGQWIQNYYTYEIPTERYIEIDKSLLDLNITPMQLGTLIKLKAYTVIYTNDIPYMITYLCLTLGINKEALKELIRKGIVKELDFGFRLVDDLIFKV